MLACRVNVAEQTLRFAIQKNIPRARRGEKAIQCARALGGHVRDITPIPRPLFDAQRLAPLNDPHVLAQSGIRPQASRGGK